MNADVTHKYTTNAQHYAELIAEREEVPVEDVDVRLVDEGDAYLSIHITFTNDNGKWFGKWIDGESLDDIRWQQA
jgi:hypothetical protein